MQNHWIVDLVFEEDDNRTACTATLSGFSAPGVRGVGIARRNPGDSPTPPSARNWPPPAPAPTWPTS